MYFLCKFFADNITMYSQGSDIPNGNISTMSDNIWSTLRMTLSLMGKPELYQAVDKRDLDHLNSVFPHESDPVPIEV